MPKNLIPIDVAIRQCQLAITNLQVVMQDQIDEIVAKIAKQCQERNRQGVTTEQFMLGLRTKKNYFDITPDVIWESLCSGNPIPGASDVTHWVSQTIGEVNSRVAATILEIEQQLAQLVKMKKIGITEVDFTLTNLKP